MEPYWSLKRGGRKVKKMRKRKYFCGKCGRVMAASLTRKRAGLGRRGGYCTWRECSWCGGLVRHELAMVSTGTARRHA